MKVIFSLVLTLFVSTSFGQNKTINAKTTIDSVTVYINGAEINRSGTVSIPAGRSEIVVSNITWLMNHKSIQASLSASGCKILSINTQKNSTSNKAVKVLQDSIDLINTEILMTQGVLDAYKREKELLDQNNGRIGTGDGVTVVELKTASDFYRKRLQEINGNMLKSQQKEIKLNAVKLDLQHRKAKMSGSEMKPYNEIVLKVNSTKTIQSKINVSYVVNQASWQPSYNIRSEGVEKPLQFEYLAKVYNGTEEDWKNVSVTLSTGEPFKSIYKPTLTAWNLNYKSDINEGRLNDKRMMMNQSYGTYADMEEEVSISTSYASVEVSELGVDFKVKEKYDIPADAQAHLVDVNEYTLKASYKYFVVPKVDKDAFLLAQVVGWESLNIMDGNANIYFNGMYVGESKISTSTASDTLSISLGRDRKIIVNRVKKEDFNKKTFIGTNRKETLTYEIALRNTYNKPVSIEIWDQVPVSQENTIEVEVIDVSGAQLDPENGKLEWNTELTPGDTKKYRVSFSVKYPKNKDVKIRKNRHIICPSKFW